MTDPTPAAPSLAGKLAELDELPHLLRGSAAAAYTITVDGLSWAEDPDTSGLLWVTATYHDLAMEAVNLLAAARAIDSGEPPPAA